MKSFSRPSIRTFALAVSFILVSMTAQEAWATGTLITVCPSGCDYSTVQSAIDSITDSSVSKPYTVMLESGVLLSNTSISLGGKNYIHFVGRGMGASVLRASTAWFDDNAGLSEVTFFDISGSTGVSVQNLTIDAKTNDPGGHVSTTYKTVWAQSSTPIRILFRGCEILGLSVALGETSGNSSSLIEVMDSKILASKVGVQIYGSIWHVFSSDIRAVQDSTSSSGAGLYIYAVGIGGVEDTTIWGSHVHAESSVDGSGSDLTALREFGTGGSILVQGSQLHLKMKSASATSSRKMSTFYTTTTTAKKIDFVGSALVYESPANLSGGWIGGVIYLSSNLSQEVNLVGTEIIDAGGTGGTARADIVGSSSQKPLLRSSGSRVLSTTLVAGGPIPGIETLHSTMNTQSGNATIVSNGTSVSVTLSPAMPDTNYRIGISADQGQVVWVTNKTTTGFTLNRATTGVAVGVDWTVTR